MVNILIAEDDKDDFLLLEEAIENTLPQYRITRSRDGKELLQRIDDAALPDMIFLDLNLPRRSGLECLIDIRQRKAFASTPVIIYSTSSDFEDIDLCYKHGCTLYLVKPRSFKDLLVQIKKIFSHELESEVLRQSEEQFRLFVQATSNQIYKISADWSQVALFGSNDPVLGREQHFNAWLQSNVIPDDHQLVLSTVKISFLHKRIIEMEYRGRKPDGSTGWTLLRAIPVLDEAGTITEWFGAAQDITDRKTAEEELKSEHYFLEQITDNTPHLIYVFDLEEQRFVYVNRRIEELTGIAPDYVYGMGPHLFKMILHPEDLGRRVDYFNSLATLRNGETRDNEFRIKVENGYHWFRSKDRIFKRLNGSVQQIIGLAEDITYEKRLEEKLVEEKGRIGMN